MNARPQVIEKTAKRFKAMQVLGVLMILGGATGIAIAIVDANVLPSAAVVVCAVAVAVGFPIWVAGRFLGWWYHG